MLQSPGSRWGGTVRTDRVTDWTFKSAAEKGSLGRGRSGTSVQSFVLCFLLCSEVIFLLQISQHFLSEIAPPMQAFSGKPPREKPPNAAADFI